MKYILEYEEFLLENKGPDIAMSIIAEKNINDDVIYLNGHQITTIPDRVYKFKNLIQLYLFDNQLSSVPDDILKLKNLVVLDLNNNKLTLISKKISQLKKLRILSLNNNNLKKLPKEFLKIEQLDIIGNDIDSIVDNWLSEDPNLYLKYEFIRKLSVSSKIKNKYEHLYNADDFGFL